MSSPAQRLRGLDRRIIRCARCPRLRRWCERVAREKTARFRQEPYWGRPVPGFGDPGARLLVVGLAPGAHGANRTGRMFTGDRSGDWLYRALHRAGFAGRAESVSRSDGQRLQGVYITAVVRCAPPGNRPLPRERDNCLPYLETELDLLAGVRVILALGGFAWDGVLRVLTRRGLRAGRKPRFSHGAEVRIGPYVLLGSYHPSQQNTFTGRLTEAMLDAVLARARRLRRVGARPSRDRLVKPT
ncbi:MAG: uracil-DNA glycosylase [Verrucomicrobiota bacterium]